jgi:hypothetical protein
MIVHRFKRLQMIWLWSDRGQHVADSVAQYLAAPHLS